MWDDDTITEVIWYRVPADTPIFESLTPFRSFYYTRDQIWHPKQIGLGEQYPYELDPCKREDEWYRGMAPFKAVPVTVCGDLVTWEDGGKRGVTPEITLDDQGRCPDCIVADQVSVIPTVEGNYCHNPDFRGATLEQPTGEPWYFFQPQTVEDNVVTMVAYVTYDGTPLPDILSPSDGWHVLLSYTWSDAPFTPRGMKIWWRRTTERGPQLVTLTATSGLARGFMWCINTPTDAPYIVWWVGGFHTAPAYPVEFVHRGSALYWFDFWPLSLATPGAALPWEQILTGFETHGYRVRELVGTEAGADPYGPIKPPQTGCLIAQYGACIGGQWGEALQTGSGGEADSGTAIYATQDSTGGEAESGEASQTAGIDQVGSGGEAESGEAGQAPGGQVGTGGEAETGSAAQGVPGGQVGTGGEAETGSAAQGVPSGQTGSGGEAETGQATQGVPSGQTGSGGEAETGQATQGAPSGQVGTGGEAETGSAAQGAPSGQTGTGGEAESGLAAQSSSATSAGTGGEAETGLAIQSSSTTQIGVGGEAETGLASQVLTLPPSYRSSSTGTGTLSTFTVPKPAGTANGDLLIAFEITNGTGSAPPAAPTGWTVFDTFPTSVATYCLRCFYKVASSEPASWTFNRGTTATSALVVVVAVRDAVTAPDAGANHGSGVGTSLATAGYTTSQGYELVVVAFANSGITVTPSAGLTDLGTFSGILVALDVCYRTRAAAGTYSAETGTQALSGAWRSMLVRIK